MYKSLKEISQELNISKSTLIKKLYKKKFKPSFKMQNKNMYSNVKFRQIKKMFEDVSDNNEKIEHYFIYIESKLNKIKI
jgi:predicted DNA-binding ribbon-helix-helix protein